MKIEDVINRNDLNERLDGDMELFRELADIFFSDYENLLEAISKALKDSDAEKLGKAAHTLKGAVSNFSARDAFEKAFTLEKIGKSGDLTKAAETLEKLEQEVKRLIEAMELLKKEESI